MEISQALLNRRTIRKFKQTPIEYDKLKELIKYASLAPFAANIQALKYKIIIEDREKIFENVKWAGYLPDTYPRPGEEPTAYIAVLGDKNIKNNFETDAGSAIQSILLGAFGMDIASCWMGAINRDEISKILKLSDDLELLYIIALGYPAEESKVCSLNGDVKYFYDENNILNVPKISTDDLII